jgi:hypothetical protein
MDVSESVNGIAVHGIGLPVETCLARAIRLSGNADAGHWRYVLGYCHVPAESPTDLWESSLDRALSCSTHIPLTP